MQELGAASVPLRRRRRRGRSGRGAPRTAGRRRWRRSGSDRPRKARRVGGAPTSPQLGTRSGSASRGHPEELAQLAGPAAGLEVEAGACAQALETSVTCSTCRGSSARPGRSRPCRRRSGPDSTSAQVRGSCSASQASAWRRSGSTGLEAAGPVSSSTRASWPASRSAVADLSAVRRSCHGDRAAAGSPRVSRSQSSDRVALVGDRDGEPSSEASTWPSTPRVAPSTVACQMSSGACSTHARPRAGAGGSSW
jgi:hypothetical protein